MIRLALACILALASCTDPCVPSSSGIVEHEDGSVTSSQAIRCPG